jgi:TonB family protein
MTLIETTQVSPISAEQVYEIRTLAESGQFADALIRLRKIKPLYPRNTFLVAMEKQLERLLVLPRDSEPSEAQKKTLLSSLPGLVKGAVDSLRQQPPARQQPAPATAPAAKPERSDRDTARAQLKEQYFQHADEYLKKGAYGSALVEIRRVKIIAPDDPTVIEYERTIRQLVELQQRTGIRAQDSEQQAAPENDSPRTGVEASPTSAPPVREQQPEVKTYGAEEPIVVEAPELPQPNKSRLLPIALSVLVVVGLAIAALAVLGNPDPMTSAGDQHETVQSTAPVETPLETQALAQPAGMKEQVVAAPVEQAVVNEPPAQSPVPAKPAAVVPAVKKEPEAAPVKEEPKSAAPSAAPVAIESDPQIVRLEEPIFSAETMRSSAGAEVIVMVQIDPEGKPIKTLIAKSTNTAFNSAIITAVMRSAYRPGTTPDGPATKWITIPYRIR